MRIGVVVVVLETELKRKLNLFFRRFHEACRVAREGGGLLVGFGDYRKELVQDLYDSKEKGRVG